MRHQRPDLSALPECRSKVWPEPNPKKTVLPSSQRPECSTQAAGLQCCCWMHQSWRVPELQGTHPPGVPSPALPREPRSLPVPAPGRGRPACTHQPAVRRGSVEIGEPPETGTCRPRDLLSNIIDSTPLARSAEYWHQTARTLGSPGRSPGHNRLFWPLTRRRNTADRSIYNNGIFLVPWQKRHDGTQSAKLSHDMQKSAGWKVHARLQKCTDCLDHRMQQAHRRTSGSGTGKDLAVDLR